MLRLRNVCTLRLSSITMTGMVVLPLSTLSTRLRSASLSALLNVRIASAHVSIFLCSSAERSRMRKCDTSSDATAMMTAANTSRIFTRRIWSVHCILSSSCSKSTDFIKSLVCYLYLCHHIVCRSGAAYYMMTINSEHLLKITLITSVYCTAARRCEHRRCAGRADE